MGDRTVTAVRGLLTGGDEDERQPRTRSKQDLPGGPAVRNSPASAGDRGLIPGLGRSHRPQGKYVHVPQLLSLRAATADV